MSDPDRDPDDLVGRTVRAERYALDTALLVEAAVAWRAHVRGGGCQRPVTTRHVAAVDAFLRDHPDWERTVTRMGEDVDEYPLHRDADGDVEPP